MGLGDDERDWIADMANLALSQRWMRWFLHREPVFARDTPTAGKSADTSGLEVFAREHGNDSRHLQRGLGVNGFNDRMCVGGTQEYARGHVGTLDVSNVVAATGQESLIFLTQRASANADDI
jgi:hypothetical protein